MKRSQDNARRVHWRLPLTALLACTACGDEMPPQTTFGSGGALTATGGASGATNLGGNGNGATEALCGVPGASPCECAGACCPTAPQCYGGDRNPQKIGDECLATRVQSADSPNANRLQFRQTWARTIEPIGNTDPNIYRVLAGGANLPLGATCNMPDSGAATGFMQLLDVDLTDPDPMKHTTTSGYAPFFTLGDYDAMTQSDGICMIEGTYDDPTYRLGADQMSSTEGWPAELGPPPMPQPWSVRPAVLRRRMSDFNVQNDRLALLQEINDSGADGVFYRDNATGYSHGFTKQTWVYVASGSNATAIAIPIREVETVYRLNNPEEQACMGAYRGNALPEGACSSTNPEDPPWGWVDDRTPGEGPAKTIGYFLLTELEQVYSSVLGRTLCTSYPGVPNSIADGYPDTTCRASVKWDPSAAGNAGLPTGNWCAAENKPATPTCHDAFRNVSFHTFAAHDVSSATCPLSGYGG